MQTMTKMNAIEIYEDAGHKAGIAAKRKDMRLVAHWQDWTNRAIAMEPNHYKEEARKAFKDAYREAAMPRF